ncbi:MAG: type IV toxin-antitoxin system AbiEi family antitoxin domain-containing protein [Solirubrobacterales bacterium]
MAERQHGVVSLDQMHAAGLTSTAVRQRARAGRLHRVHQGVYAVGHPLLSAEGRWMAAVLACGPGAVLSHRSAAALWGLRHTSRSLVDVTAPHRRGRAPEGIAAHRDGSLRAPDRTVVRGIPCTSLARTLLDLAGVVDVRELRSLITEAEVLHLFDLTALQEVMDRNRGRRGIARLRLVISEFDPRVELTRQELERRFLALCDRAGLPTPEINAPLELDGGNLIPDFLWREAGLIVETDGRQFHDTASAFERDRLRDQRLTLAGWRVIRCTWRQVVGEPAELARTVRTLLTQLTAHPGRQRLDVV